MRMSKCGKELSALEKLEERYYAQKKQESTWDTDEEIGKNTNVQNTVLY